MMGLAPAHPCSYRTACQNIYIYSIHATCSIYVPGEKQAELRHPLIFTKAPPPLPAPLKKYKSS